MLGEEDIDVSTLNSQLSQTQTILNQEMDRSNSELHVFQEKLHESEEHTITELELLCQRVKTTTTLLSNLKSKSILLTIPMSDLSRNIDLSNFDFPKVNTWINIDNQHDIHIYEALKSVQMVIDVMESLVKRIIIAESETDNEKHKFSLGEEEIKKKTIQIENMSQKLDEMDRFAVGTNRLLNELRQRVQDLVQETSIQRQQAAENEQELSRVKQDFESLKTYVTSLVSVRETLVSSEKQFQNIERFFERLVEKTTQLEGEKAQKETEIQKLMDQNLKLNALLNKKEAQLLAMNEQCKLMALNASNN